MQFSKYIITPSAAPFTCCNCRPCLQADKQMHTATLWAAKLGFQLVGWSPFWSPSLAQLWAWFGPNLGTNWALFWAQFAAMFWSFFGELLGCFNMQYWALFWQDFEPYFVKNFSNFLGIFLDFLDWVLGCLFLACFFAIFWNSSCLFHGLEPWHNFIEKSPLSCNLGCIIHAPLRSQIQLHTLPHKLSRWRTCASRCANSRLHHSE